jgi:hypothetical protein
MATYKRNQMQLEDGTPPCKRAKMMKIVLKRSFQQAYGDDEAQAPSKRTKPEPAPTTIQPMDDSDDEPTSSFEKEIEQMHRMFTNMSI